MALRDRGGWAIWKFTLIGFVVWSAYKLIFLSPEIYAEMGYHFTHTLPVYAVFYFVGLLFWGALVGAMIAGVQNLYVLLFKQRK